jgi:hypothetical protein
MLDFNLLARLYMKRHYSEVEERVKFLIQRFRALSMSTHVLKAKFLRASNLKELAGNPHQILGVLTDVYREALRERHFILSALLASSIAQMNAKVGNQRLADCYATIGLRLAKRLSCPWVEAYAASTWGELLRDRGEYLEAVKAYRTGAQVYADNQMYSLEAYVRVITAETLLIAGYEDEAIAELLLAFPIIERESLVEEAEASVWIMRQAIAQKHLSPGMLRDLRDRLSPVR